MALARWRWTGHHLQLVDAPGTHSDEIEKQEASATVLHAASRAVRERRNVADAIDELKMLSRGRTDVLHDATQRARLLSRPPGAKVKSLLQTLFSKWWPSETMNLTPGRGNRDRPSA